MDLLRSTIREIWINLPAWFILYTSIAASFGDIAFLEKPRYDFAFLFILPFILFLLYYFSYVRAAEYSAKKTRVYLSIVFFITLFLFIMIMIAAGPIRFGNNWPDHFDRLVYYYEISNILWALLLAGHCLQFRGWKGLLVFFGAAFLYGMILESSGITMGYFSEDHYHLYLPGLSAPVATMFGWSTVFYPSVFILEGIGSGIAFVRKRSFVWHAFLVSAVACIFDAHLDPYATAFGLWRWNGLYRAEGGLHWFGVPLVNFISWFAAVFSFGLFYYNFKRKSWTQLQKALAMLLSVPLILMVAAFIEFSALGITEGFNGPSWKILKSYFREGMPLVREPVKGKMKGNDSLSR